MNLKTIRIGQAIVLLLTAVTLHFMVVSITRGHGDVAPQAVDTEGLESLGDEFLEENPYRLAGGEQYKLAIEIGASG